MSSGPFRSFAEETGELALLSGRAFRALLTPPWDLAEWLRQMNQIGVRSLGVAAITTIFTGMVLALQTAYSLPSLGIKYYIGTVVSKSLTRELGPVLIALIVGGRIGAGITAELGTMKVTEQIDALRAMAADPVRKLVAPRLAASLVMLPCLTILGDLLGVLGGMLIAVAQLRLSAGLYLNDVLSALTLEDVLSGVGKSFVFGYFIAIVACHHGLKARGGADGVGRATTSTVVLAAVLVLISDFFLTKLFHLFLSDPVSDDPILEVKGLHKSYGEHDVLLGIDFELEDGECLVILGGSGSGKSVLLRQLNGLETPDRGQVLFHGRDLAPLTERELFPIRRRVGMLFQGGALFDSMSVADNIAFPLREHTDLSEDEIAEKIGERLNMVQLDGIQEKLPADLSGGMKKRVALARSLALDPEVMLWDEPTTGLDPRTSATIAQLVLRTGEHLGISSVVVTHDLPLARTVGDRVAFLHRGNFRFLGTWEEADRSDDEQLRPFLDGIPEVNDAR